MFTGGDASEYLEHGVLGHPAVRAHWQRRESTPPRG
jgi:hypothetical protein